MLGWEWAVQLNPQTIDAASRVIAKFRIGGAAISVIPLVFGAMEHYAGNASRPFLITSTTLLFLVLWIGYCAERFISTLRADSSNAAGPKLGEGEAD